MPSPRLRALLIVAAFGSPVFAQAPPTAELGEPAATTPLPILDPALLQPLLRPLGSPDDPFRPFAPLGPPPNVAAENIGSRFGLGVLGGRFGIPGYGLMWIPPQPVSGQPTNLGVVRQDLSLFAPIYHDGQDTAALGLGIHGSIFSTDAILPTSGMQFPSSVWDIQSGVAYSHQWDNGWTTGAVVSAGSASDKPFAQSNVLVASVAMYMAFPDADRNAWLVGFSYSPTSDSPYPLPIIAYYWHPSDEVEATIGLPTYVKWHFDPQFTLEAYWIPLRTVSARLTWQTPDFPGWRFYGAFDWANESYFLADRPDNSDRFYCYEKRLTGGVQFDLPYKLRLDMSVGYAFDRFYFQGKQYSDRNTDRVNVGSGIFGAIQLRLQF